MSSEKVLQVPSVSQAGSQALGKDAMAAEEGPRQNPPAPYRRFPQICPPMSDVRANVQSRGDITHFSASVGVKLSSGEGAGTVYDTKTRGVLGSQPVH